MPAWSALSSARRVLLFHAHPDDETLTTGPLIAELVEIGVDCMVVTATRGEQGEVVPGAVDAADGRTLEEIRRAELAGALAALGVSRDLLLGTPPARVPGAPRIRYRDSGMRWVRPGLAGPADVSDASSFTGRPIADAVADLMALLASIGTPDALVGYDAVGSYGHPDHVRAHHVVRQAASLAGVPFIEVASEDHAGATDPSFEWVPLPRTRDRLRAALSSYRTQFTLRGEVLEPWPEPGEHPLAVPGFLIRHVGGQAAVVRCRAGLRRADSRAGDSARR
jgi:N-acetyl-1-D-myo-inositol-2-amino-2-deoxy-alpha-D-glucopyranoside deacetylase